MLYAAGTDRRFFDRRCLGVIHKGIPPVRLRGRQECLERNQVTGLPVVIFYKKICFSGNAGFYILFRTHQLHFDGKGAGLNSGGTDKGITAFCGFARQRGKGDRRPVADAYPVDGGLRNGQLYLHRYFGFNFNTF